LNRASVMIARQESRRPMQEYLTTRELAQLLRISERKVYDIAQSGEIACTRATGKLLFPRDAVAAWLERSSASPQGLREGHGGSMGGSMGGSLGDSLPRVLLGSHDPLLDWALRESGCGIATYFDGSGDGLDRFARGEGIAAGLHIFDPQTGQWNRPAVERRFDGADCVLVEFARRRRGLVLAPALASQVDDIPALKGRRFAPRQPASGAQMLFEHLLAQAGMTIGDIGVLPAARTETEAALAVLEGKADAAFGLQSLAGQHALVFVPIVEERFDLLVNRREWFEPAFQAFLAFCRGQRFHEQAAAMAGYDVSGLGAVQYNAAPIRQRSRATRRTQKRTNARN
jgi:putative molybdopterin biosynthesis protein